MDIFFNKLTLHAIGIMVVTVLLVYSVVAVHRVGFNTYFKNIGQLGRTIARPVGTFMTSLVGLLAGSVKYSDTNEASDNAARGGVFNFRTGKFDDGTDPAGWYEKD